MSHGNQPSYFTKINKQKAREQLVKVMHSYTHKSQECYDPEFDAEIRELAPQWFTVVPLNTKNPN